MFKPSRRALAIAASFAIGVSAVGPAAHAGLLGGGDSESAVEGVPLPLAGDLLGGGLLGGGLLGGLGGGEGLLGGILGGEGLLGGGLPLVGPVLAGLPLLGGESGGLLAGEGLVGLVPDLGILPGLGSVTEILSAFSESGSIVPGLQVLDELGVLGILGSL